MSDRQNEPSSLPRAQVAPAEMPGIQGLTTLAVGVVVVAALYLGREVLIPITVAILLSFVLAPLVDVLRRLHLGRVFSVILAVLMALGVILALGGMIGTQLADLADDIPRYQYTVEKKIDAVRDFMAEHVSGLMHSIPGASRTTTSPHATAPQAEPSGETTTQAPPPVPVEVVQPSMSPMQLTRRLLGPVLSPLATTGIVFVVAIFILLQQEDLRDRLIRLFGSSDLHRTTGAMDEAARRLSRYFLTQLAINASFGGIIGVGLLVLGVPSPVLWGVMAALLRFVPYVGPWLAAAFPVLLGAAIDTGWTTVLLVLALFAVTEMIMGQVVEPLLYGHSTGLSPFSVVVAAIFWGWLWGAIGLILSTPLTLCLVVLGRHVDRLEFLDVLLGDRPALTPIENFYQRALAGDSDEAQEQAEIMLKERSLSSYYDEVVLKALQLAANDLERGVLTDPQLLRINTVVAELVEGLDDHNDADPESGDDDNAVLASPDDQRQLPKQPAPDTPAPAVADRAPDWQDAAPVLCVAGRGPLDEAASIILAQLLRKHEIAGRLVAHEVVSRTAIHRLDVHGVAMICISYLEIRGTPSHLRYLIRRLRRAVPGAPIVVGLWPSGEALLGDEDLRRAVGADYYVTSMRDAVASCLSVVRAESEAVPDAEPAAAQ